LGIKKYILFKNMSAAATPECLFPDKFYSEEDRSFHLGKGVTRSRLLVHRHGDKVDHDIDFEGVTYSHRVEHNPDLVRRVLEFAEKMKKEGVHITNVDGGCGSADCLHDIFHM